MWILFLIGHCCFCTSFSRLVCIESRLARCGHHIWRWLLLFWVGFWWLVVIGHSCYPCAKFEGANKTTHRIPRNLVVGQVRCLVPSDICCPLCHEASVIQMRFNLKFNDFQSLTACNYVSMSLSVPVCVESRLAQCGDCVWWWLRLLLDVGFRWVLVVKFQGADKSTHAVPGNLDMVWVGHRVSTVWHLLIKMLDSYSQCICHQNYLQSFVWEQFLTSDLRILGCG